MKKRIGIVILAAGQASRMGTQKLLLPLAGRPLLAHVLQAATSAALPDCVAVIGEPQAELAAVCRQYSMQAVYNPNRQAGQAASIQLALCHLPVELDGILFLLGDQPLVSLPLLHALMDRFACLDDNRHIIVPYCSGQRRNPVLFGAFWRGQLAALQGDRGGRRIIDENLEWVARLDWADETSFLDADTWEDYEFLCAKFRK
ncbi:MAG: MobA-like transferase domain containing protein [Firmicutes bacterium]|nr:MobA-like transferase domain containing protein [Bacillota bacterium]